MSKKADTWMPLYVGEYLADTTNLNTEQHGAYFLMLLAAWKRGGMLPNDDGQLASITKLTPARWKAHRALLLELFRLDGSQLVHKRVTEERQKAQAISEKKAANGRAGAAAKWSEDGNDMPDGAADAMAEAMASEMANGVANDMAIAMANASQTDAPTPSPSQAPSELFPEPDGSSSPAKPPTLPDCPHLRLIDLYAERLPTLTQPKPELWAGKNADAMRARWKWVLTAKRRSGERYASSGAEAEAWFGRFFAYVAKSDFLTGRVGNFNCTLQWLMKAENFEKVVQGNYVNKEAA